MGHNYLINNAEDQMYLQQILGDSDSRFQDFGKEFHQMMQLKLSNTKNTLSKSSKGIVPDFMIENADLTTGSVLQYNKLYVHSVCVE
jgi:hypothetical protein